MAKRLVLFAKAPLPGQVKTRLVPPLTVRESAAFYRACLEDACRLARRLSGVERYIAYTPPEGPLAWLPGDFRRFPQARGELGARLDAAFQRLLNGGAHQVILLGTDHPTLTAARVADGFQALRHADIVIGPTRDGGYYLIGAKRFPPVTLRGVRWSSAQTCRETLERVHRAGLRAILLPEAADVDTPWDLMQLLVACRRRRMSQRSAAGRWLDRWASRSGW